MYAGDTLGIERFRNSSRKELSFMPTFGYTSDVHLSFYPKSDLPQVKWATDVDVILLAGDIMDGVKPYAIEHVLQMTQGIPTLMTLGNHELYGMRRDKAVRELRAGFAGTHAQLLLNESLVIDGVRIAGTDLWTDFDLLGDSRNAMLEAEKSMNDYRKIRVLDQIGGQSRYRKMRPLDTAKWHGEARDFILRTLNESDEPVVLLTHHAPSSDSVPGEYKRHRLSPCYASDLSGFYASAAKAPIVNVHGHIHKAQSYRMDCGTHVLANPMGYFGHEEATDFDPQRRFSVNRDGILLTKF